MTHDALLAYSWEFVTTLEYEWEVIQGRLPYQRTIWVRNNMLFRLGSLFPSLSESPADMVVRYSIDLLAYTGGCPFGHNS